MYKKEIKSTTPRAGGNNKVKKLFWSKEFKMLLMISKGIVLVSLRGAVAMVDRYPVAFPPY